MKMAKFLKALFAVGVVATCSSMFAACSSPAATTSSSAVAATVNGTEISEDTVATTIQNVREQSGIEDEESWAKFLIENDMTPQSVREQIIDSLVNQELVKAGAADLGVTVESSEIDTYVDSMKANFDSDDAWSKALSQAGFTEESYRENIETSLLQQKINTHFQDEVKLSDKELLESAQTYTGYYDGAKRSSHILIGVEDTSNEAAMKEAREKAQKLLDQINDGADFAELAKENSTDTGSAENGGDVGWDVLNSFVSEYTDAVDSLDKGEVSDLVESQYGIHIIKVTDVFNAPEKLKKISDLPEEFQTTITDMAKSVKANEDYDAWLEEQHDSADIVINDMPADAPYNVDLSKYGSDEAADADSDDDPDAAAADEDSEEGSGTAENPENLDVDVEVEGEGEEAATDEGDVEVIDVEELSDDAAASDGAAASGEAAESDDAAASDGAEAASDASASSESAK